MQQQQEQIATPMRRLIKAGLSSGWKQGAGSSNTMRFSKVSEARVLLKAAGAATREEGWRKSKEKEVE